MNHTIGYLIMVYDYSNHVLKNRFEKIIIYSFCASFWSDSLIALGLLLVAGVIILSRKMVIKQKSYPLDSTEVLLFFFILASLVPAINEATYIRYVKAVVYPLAIYWVFKNSTLTSRNLNKVLLLLIFSCFLIVTVMLFQESIGKFNFSFERLISIKRERGFYFLQALRGNTVDGKILNPTAIAASGGLLALLSLFVLTVFQKKKIIFILLIFYGIFVVVLTGGRSVMLALLFTFSAYVFLSNYQKEQKKVLKTSFTFGVLILFFALMVIQFSEFIPALEKRMQVFLELEADGSLGTRFYLWGNAYLLIFQNIFGYGYDFFVEKFGMTTHNEFLGHLVAGGLIAGILYMMLYIVIAKNTLYRIFNSDKNIKLNSIIISLLIFYIIYGMAEHFSISRNDTFYPIIWIFLGVQSKIFRDKINFA